MVSESTVSNTELSESFGPLRAPGRELSAFCSAYYLCVTANSPSFSQNSPRLLQNSLSEFTPLKQYSRNRYSARFLSGKKKAHKHKLLCPVGLGTTPGLSRGHHRVCPWDKPGFSPYFTQWTSPISPGLSLGQTRFVPGTIPGTKGGTESLGEKSLCAFFARYPMSPLRECPVQLASVSSTRTL